MSLDSGLGEERGHSLWGIPLGSVGKWKAKSRRLEGKYGHRLSHDVSRWIRPEILGQGNWDTALFGPGLCHRVMFPIINGAKSCIIDLKISSMNGRLICLN